MINQFDWMPEITDLRPVVQKTTGFVYLLESSMTLNNKRLVFTKEYLKDFNATQAAIRAGYSPKTAYSQGQRLLKNVEIKEVLAERLDELTMSAEEVLVRLGEQARSSIADVIEPTGKRTFLLDTDKIAEHGHLIKRIYHTKHGVGIELYNSQRALELIGKKHALFTDRIEGKLDLGIDKIIIELKPDGRTEDSGD